ncbi:hypothetical protein MPTK1_3g03040 [Marchantia polymorpha subsp. ruderalis]|uniref:BTB domain-containing protein n=4 Tax=Marchantia polymorpha TaxID=3197 RepID=A0AAF6AWW8_MARPO|nr:hypothetical protein MARPO_0007s0288 [Marchantia polymorpha]BBN04252.1 hypothetical protein Mp_3g03040 [Marchantia polymorpha subsp. ruderalis]|eukprot:PTQ47938.1 hypothetical protein MARPO_0007s0288 [Marchantia polymorpha]
MNSDRLMDDFLPPIARNYRVERSARFDEDGDVLRESTKLGCYYDMLQMLNNPDSSDMTFMCQDGVKVYTCRLLKVPKIKVKVERAKNMLTNGMAESQQSEVVLHEITSPVLLLILEYIYTGWIMLESFERRAKVYLSRTPEACWKTMLQTIRGARFFLLQTVEDLMIQHLVRIVKLDAKFKRKPRPNQVVKAALRLSYAAEVMASVGDDDKDSSDLRFICNSQMKILQLGNDTEGPGSVSDNLGSFSARGFQFFLQNSQNLKENDNRTLSIDEYQRLRQVVLWCATQALEHGQLEDLTLPTAKCARSLVNTDADPGLSDVLVPPSAAFSKAWESVKVALTEKLTTMFLSMVDLKRIHPEILIYVIEDLGIFPSNVLESVFRVQALPRARLEKEIRRLRLQTSS